MGIKWEDSYLGQVRRLVGNRMLLSPSVRAIITDDRERILFVRRNDNGRWVLPAGSMELNESILDSLKREVREETGLEVVSAVPIAIHSEPRFQYTNIYGDQYQLFSVVFAVEEWCGQLLTVTDETTDAQFFDVSHLPDTPDNYLETIEDFKRFDGRMTLK